MTALPNRHYSGHHKTVEDESDHRTCGKWSGKRNVDNKF